MRILNPSVKDITINDQGMSLDGEVVAWQDVTVTLTRASEDIWHEDPENVSFPTYSGRACLFDKKYAAECGLLGSRVVLIESLSQKVTHLFPLPVAVLGKLHPYLDAVKLEPVGGPIED